MVNHDDSEESHDDTLDEALRELARPPAVGGAALAHIQVPSTLDMPPPALAQAVGVPPEPAPGDVLEGRWRVERELGRGGMGVVYAARNLRTDKRVAIKWLSTLPGGSPAQRSHMVERFRREARAAAGIRHPNVVEVYDVGGPDDAPFMVMELLEGESLRTRLARGRLSWEEARAIMLPVMRGVHAAHRAGVVHRDLKPDNLFLCNVEGAVVPKVLDFGVAAMKAGSHDGLHSLTRSGTVVGTPSYMPLEQLTGGSVDERADVYALGVVLYEALAGTLPFAARSASELAVMQATGRPVPLSDRVPGLRGAREQAVLKALAREPSGRPATVEELARTLEALPEHEAEARPGGRSRFLALLVLAALLTGLALAWRGRSGSSPDARAPEADGLKPVPTTQAPGSAPLRAPAQPAAQSPAAPVATEPTTPAQAAPPSGTAPADTAPANAGSGSARPEGKPGLPRARKPRGEPRNEPARPPTDLTFEDF